MLSLLNFYVCTVLKRIQLLAKFKELQMEQVIMLFKNYKFILYNEKNITTL